MGASGLAGMLGNAGFTGLASMVSGMASPIATFTTALNSGIAAAGGFASVLGAAVPIIGGLLLLLLRLVYLTMKQVLRSTTI